MARQAGNIFIEGIIDDLSFYRMDGKYYVRLKSSLTGKKFGRVKPLQDQEKAVRGLLKGTSLLQGFTK
jgi:hypothetical protein